ncbi:hypothetical protein [Aeromonas veronii]|uniref:hypothetical protein n=1 Tax=Aeromonas veronii TaxID=654 RepID=UPI003B9E303C
MYLNSIYATVYARDIGIIFSGCKNGNVLLIEDDTLSVVNSFRAHDGVIKGMSICEDKEVFGMISSDRHVSLYKYSKQSLEVKELFNLNIRDAGVDDHVPLHSPSQAFDISPVKEEVATRSGNSSLIFIDFHGNVTHKLRLHSSDIATVKYSKCGSYVLIGGTGGEITIVSNYKIKDHLVPENITETMHWFEEVSEHYYLVACDARKMVALTVDPENFTLSYKLGDIFTRDDLEHVTYKKGELFALATSFDRNIYKVNINTLQNIGICFQASYKMRWLDYHRNEIDTVIVQVRDGSLLKVNISSGNVLSKYSEMPPTIWSLDSINKGRYVAVGENGIIIDITNEHNQQALKINKSTFININGGYFKRVCSDNSGGYLAGSTSGFLLSNKSNTQELIYIGSAVRDICYSLIEKKYYIALEDGRVVSYQLGEITNIWKSEQPIWSLAISPDNSTLSFAERMGKIYLMDIQSGAIIESSFSRLPKRMKWENNSTLYFTHSDSIDKITLTNEGWQHYHRFIDPSSNTVEDFVIWREYILMITYTNRLWLADINSGEILDSAFYGSEYMKSISIIDENKFTLMGRSGAALTYSINCEQLLPIGIQWYSDDI